MARKGKEENDFAGPAQTGFEHNTARETRVGEEGYTQLAFEIRVCETPRGTAQRLDPCVEIRVLT